MEIAGNYTYEGGASYCHVMLHRYDVSEITWCRESNGFKGLSVNTLKTQRFGYVHIIDLTAHSIVIMLVLEQPIEFLLDIWTLRNKSKTNTMRPSDSLQTAFTHLLHHTKIDEDSPLQKRVDKYRYRCILAPYLPLYILRNQKRSEISQTGWHAEVT